MMAGSAQKPTGSGTRTPARQTASRMRNSSARERLDAMVAAASMRSTKARVPPPTRQRTSRFSWMEPPPRGRMSAMARSGQPRCSASHARSGS